MTSIDDYIIDHAEFDWLTLFDKWTWLLPNNFTVWIMNRFGDLFIVLEDGTIHMLDVGRGSLEKVAEHRDDFAQKVNIDDNVNDWLMIPLVDQLVAFGLTLSAGQCYTYRQPPVLGGDYTVDNVVVMDIPQHYAVYGSIHQQIKDVPDGTEVRIKTRE